MTHSNFSAFAAGKRIAQGTRDQVAAVLRTCAPDTPQLFVFDDHTGSPIDLDLREGAEAASPAPAPEAPRGVGRPKLGVVAREVTLLPGHWGWLNRQPGGASVALRKLVEDARRVSADDDRQRAAQEAAYRFMQAMAGNEAGFDEAARALFAGDIGKFEQHSATWPDDVREHAALLAADAFHH